MKPGPTNIQPILREIDVLVDKIRKAVVDESEEYKRTRALMLLDGISEILRAFCFSPSPDTAYEEFEFPMAKPGRRKSRGK
jgi:hypothetical protein